VKSGDKLESSGDALCSADFDPGAVSGSPDADVAAVGSVGSFTTCDGSACEKESPASGLRGCSFRPAVAVTAPSDVRFGGIAFVLRCTVAS
jgi:hypothetical protein